MARPIPEWVIHFGPDNTIISTATREGGDFFAPFAYVDRDAQTTVVSVSAHTRDYAERTATHALHEHQTEMAARLDSTRRVPA